MINILEFCLSPNLGGLELFAINCFKYFKKETNCKIIVSKNDKMDKYLSKYKKDYIKRNKLFPLFSAIKLAKFIDNYNIQIIHFHWTKDMLVVVLAKILSKNKPKIIQTRNMTITRYKNDFYHKWLYKNISAIHAVTYQVKEQLEKFIPNNVRPKIEVVYMGTKSNNINKNMILKLKKKYGLTNEFVIGIVGRIEEGKGQYLVIEAINKLKHLNIKALIVGHTMNEDYLQKLKTKIKKMHIEDKIIFTGFTKDVNEHIKLCDTTILATSKETFGLVIIESMINKVPVIATNNGGPLEIIDNMQDGLLFNRTVDDLIIKIKLLYENKQLKNILAENGYQKILKKFDENTQLKILFEYIQKL
jgi:glycosyltransferase involved in cell wall biosynthesis